MEEVIEEYNDIFQVINPNFQFVLNYSPTEEEINDDPYGVDVYLDDLGENVGGDTKYYFTTFDEGFDGFGLANMKIRLNNKFAFNGATFAHIFRHEFLHTFGCGDAYLNENATHDTIMQTVSTDMVGLYCIDVAFLDALYRDPNNAKTEEEINDFIAHYDDFTKYNRNDTLIRILMGELQNFDFSLLKDEISKSAYSSADINAVLAGLGDTLEFQSMQNVSNFAELKGDEEKDEYYYYETPYNNADPLEYHVNLDPMHLYGMSEVDYVVGEQLLLNEYGWGGWIYTKVDDYILSLKVNYNFNNLTTEFNASFDALYQPTEKDIMEYRQEVLSWYGIEEKENIR